MTTIIRKIQESKIRESKATPGPIGIQCASCFLITTEKDEPRIAEFEKKDDGHFFLQARTMEPRFRDALELAIKQRNSLITTWEEDAVARKITKLNADIEVILLGKDKV